MQKLHRILLIFDSIGNILIIGLDNNTHIQSTYLPLLDCLACEGKGGAVNSIDSIIIATIV